MVDYLLIPAYYQKEVYLSKEVLDKLKKFEEITLFASVQFIKLDKLISQLAEKGVKIHYSKSKRTSGKYQLLGCDCYANSFEKQQG